MILYFHREYRIIIVAAVVARDHINTLCVLCIIVVYTQCRDRRIWYVVYGGRFNLSDLPKGSRTRF